MSPAKLTRKERAINNMQCRMPWSEAELYATELDLRGFLESGDRSGAIEFLAAHMPRRRAEGVIHDLVMCRIMWHPDYA